MTRNELKTCNLDYLYELAKGDMGFVREMIDVFISDNSGELDNLEKKIGESNYEAIRQIAHKLRSSIPYVGLDKIIGEDVMQIEELAREERDLQKISSLYKNVRGISDIAMEELRGLEV